MQGQLPDALTFDVEDWYHILATSAAPDLGKWASLEDRVERNVEQILGQLAQTRTKGTFFWLGWVAERHPRLVRACLEQGHEIASHGYAHLLAYEAGPSDFRQDITRARQILEDVVGQRIAGFRAPGFGVTAQTPWVFEVIREAGYEYDSSVFPAVRSHGGMPGARPEPHVIETPSGPVTELPMSAVQVLGKRICPFSGGYFRLAPQWLLRVARNRLRSLGRPLIALVHPREVDPDQPRLRLGMARRFKSYVNLHTTLPKLRWLCGVCEFEPMRVLAQAVALQPQTAHVSPDLDGDSQ